MIILTILITIYVTMGALVVIKEFGDRLNRVPASLIISFLFAPIILISDIIAYWEDEKKRYDSFISKYGKDK